jgi:hypothetical protein
MFLIPHGGPVVSKEAAELLGTSRIANSPGIVKVCIAEPIPQQSGDRDLV